MSFLTGFSFFLAELVILWLCYHSIYRKSNTSSKSLWDFIRALSGYYSFMLAYRWRYRGKDPDMDQFLQKHQDLRNQMYLSGLTGMAEVVVLPFLIVWVIRYLNIAGIGFLVYAAGLGTLLGSLKEYRIMIMSLLNESQKFLFQFTRKKKHMKKEQARASKKQNAQKKWHWNKNMTGQMIVIVLLIICADIVAIRMLKDMPQMMRNFLKGSMQLKSTVFFSPVFVVLAVSILILYFIFRFLDEEVREYYRQKRSYRRYLKALDEIRIWTADEKSKEEIESWLDEILYMCGLLRIWEIKIGIDDLHTKKVVSICMDTQMPVIIIGRDVFQKSQRYEARIHHDMIKLLFAHELVHIHYQDTKWMKKVCGWALFYIGVSLAAIYYAARLQSTVFYWIAVLLCLCYLLFHRVTDERYWKQVMEFRADRIGMAVSGTSPDILEKALQCTTEGDNGEENQEKKGVLHKIYKKNVVIHPDYRRRVKEAQRNRPWGIGEYFRYLWLISRNVMLGKGWKI